MEFQGLVAYPAIVVLCFVIGIGIKAIPCVLNKAIPFFVSVSGIILGAICYFTIDSFADNLITALAIGAISGLASTGVNELAKWVKGE